MLKFGGSVLVLFCIVAACGSSEEHSTLTPAPLNSATIGAAGGTVMSSDGNLSVAIPAGALTTATNITVTATNPTQPGFVDTAYDIGPTGTTFATPITLTFKVPANQDASKLAVGTLGGAWVILATTSAAGTLSAQTPHLSTYALVNTCQPACATGEECAFIGQDSTPSCGNLAGGIDAGADANSADSGADSADCTTTCTTGCCDKNNVCHADGATNLANCGQPGGACRACSGNNAQCIQGLCVAGAH